MSILWSVMPNWASVSSTGMPSTTPYTCVSHGLLSPSNQWQQGSVCPLFLNAGKKE